MKNAEKIARAFAALQHVLRESCCSVEVRGGDGVKTTVTFQSASDSGVDTLAAWFGISLQWVSSVSGTTEWRQGEKVFGDIVVSVYGASRTKQTTPQRDVKSSPALAAALAQAEEAVR